MIAVLFRFCKLEELWCGILIDAATHLPVLRLYRHMETKPCLVVLVDLDIPRGSLGRSNPQERLYVAAVGATAFFRGALPHADDGGVCCCLLADLLVICFEL